MRMEQLTPLIEAAGLGLSGKDLFIYFMPADVTVGVLVVSSLSGSKINYDLPGYRKDVGFQIIVRGPNLNEALTRATAIMKAVTITKRIMLPAIPSIGAPAIYVSYARPLHDPQPYPRMLGKGWEVSMNFMATYANQNGSI